MVGTSASQKNDCQILLLIPDYSFYHIGMLGHELKKKRVIKAS